MDNENVKGFFGCIGCLGIILIAGVLIKFPELIVGGLGLIVILLILLPIPFIPVYIFSQYFIKQIDEFKLSRLKTVTIITLFLLISTTIFYGLLYGKLVSSAYFKYFITLLLIYHIRNLFIAIESIKLRIIEQDLFLEFIKKSYVLVYTSLFTIFCYLIISSFLSDNVRWWVNLLIWIATLCMQTFAIYRLNTIIKIGNNFFLKLDNLIMEGDYPVAINDYKHMVHEEYDLSEDDSSLVYELVESVYLQYLADEKLREINLVDEIYLFQIKAYTTKYAKLKKLLSKEVRYPIDKLPKIIYSILHIDVDHTHVYMKTHIDFGEIYEFDDGLSFVSYTYRSNVKVCSSCGFCELIEDVNDAPEWFCSDFCVKTDATCKTIIKTPIEEFISDAVEKSFILTANGEAWKSNQKLFAIDGQGHGYAAEKANNLIDKLQGKNATILGDDNAKNGPDRILDNKLIQTKYCQSGKASVDAAFQKGGSYGTYRYLDEKGKPMLLEVPKDQYEDAVKEMAKKIKNGDVPGVKDPRKAQSIIHKGHITYQQAKNIIKFGTFESLSYDIAEGSITATAAGGISFFITSFIIYIKTKDKKQALQVGGVQAGKTFARTLTVYVGTQQLHRLEIIQKSLNVIDIKKLSPSLQKFFKKGLNANSANKANQALKGQVLTAAVIIVVSESVDFYKFVNGYMSSTEFMRNAINTTAGVGGGVAGAIAGQAMIPIPVVGGIIGGTIGGLIATKTSDMVGEHVFGERDKEKIVPLIKKHFSYLCYQFALTHEEIENFNLNMSQVLNNKVYEVIFACPNRRAIINSYLYPIVICIVKQRPLFQYDNADIFDAFEE